MPIPSFDLQVLLKAGVHFGHPKHRWNPKMETFLFGVRGGMRIIDLSQTVLLLRKALEFVSDVTARRGRLLIVGTKRQAQAPVAEAATRSAQYYVNNRWLGGMLTNWNTISVSINRLCEVEKTLASEEAKSLTKKERLLLDLKRRKLDRDLGGIREMAAVPDLIFVIDTNREAIAVKEARCLGVPVAAILDSNSDPDGIAYPIPGNDDSSRAIKLYMDLLAGAALDGLEKADDTGFMNKGVSVRDFAKSDGGAIHETSSKPEGDSKQESKAEAKEDVGASVGNAADEV